MGRLLGQWTALLMLIALVLVLDFVSRHWDFILACILIAVTLVIAYLILSAIGKSQDRRHLAAAILQKEKDMRESVLKIPRSNRYAWSDDFNTLYRQWKKYEASGKTPIKKRTAARKLQKSQSTCPIIKEVLRINGEIRKSAKLQRYNWSENNEDFIWQWRLFEEKGRTPIKRSTAERKRLSKSMKPYSKQAGEQISTKDD